MTFLRHCKGVKKQLGHIFLLSDILAKVLASASPKISPIQKLTRFVWNLRLFISKAFITLIEFSCLLGSYQSKVGNKDF